MEKLITALLLAYLLYTFAFVAGSNQACASAKECPDGFRARFIEAGCLCVPVRKESK